ncbi:MAG: DUF4160 domain-containing protein [Saprospiraceae bacterium]|nr:DUF4160 domain-containing protein [Saprospiraceae bacterium]
MPEISRFYGIVIYMYFKDHFPPHFHAVYNEFEALMSIESGEIMQGDIPKKQLRLVQAWTELYREELLKNFALLSSENPSYIKINPL